VLQDGHRLEWNSYKEPPKKNNQIKAQHWGRAIGQVVEKRSKPTRKGKWTKGENGGRIFGGLDTFTGRG